MSAPSLADLAEALGQPGAAMPANVAELQPVLADGQWAGSLTGRLNAIAAGVGAEDVTVTFAGHFSCGKSTLINALTGRPLLPTSDYPETGVPCRLASGSKDRVVAVTRDGRLDLSLDTAAIAQVVSLIGEDGEYRRVYDVQRLEITLADSALPVGLALVDSPGINEIAEMTTRATAVAKEADILVWVFNSKQPVSESEQALLFEYLEGRTRGSLLLIVNAFLPADTAEHWAWFLAERAPRLQRRLDSALGLWDGSGAEGPAVLFVSARAAGSDPSGFGAPAVRQLIAGFTLHSPWVRAARLTRAETQLNALIAELDERVAHERMQLDRARAVLNDRQQAARLQRQKFERSLARDVAAAFARHRAAARECAGEMAAEIGSQPLQPTGAYGELLTRGLREITRRLATEVLAETSRSAGRFGMTSPSQSTARQVRKLLAPGAAEIVVPDTPVVKTRRRLGVTVGGVLGSFVALGPGTAVGAALGGVLGSVADGRRDAASRVQEREAAQASALAAGEIAVTALMNHQEAVKRMLRADCRPAEPLQAAPDDKTLEQLMSLRNRLRDQQMRQLSWAASAAREEAGW
jgi:hypothetical protein